jgi:hypothetical protein
MTNMDRPQGANLATGSAAADPIDALIPPPRRWWVRLIAALALVVVVGTVAYLWGSGYLYPQPDCCGSGSGDTPMALSKDGKAVTVTAYMSNSSGRDLRVVSANADLAGATVSNVEVVDDEDFGFPILKTAPLPATVAGHDDLRLAITFTPDRCVDNGKPWGTVSTQLEVINGWLPAIGRSYELPDPIYRGSQWSLSVFPPAGIDTSVLATPLAAACALLGISQ